MVKRFVHQKTTQTLFLIWKRTNRLIEESGKGCNFQLLHLVDSTLMLLNFRKADFRGGFFDTVDLYGADLSDANFKRTRLERVDLREANLEGADMRGSYLFDVLLKNANLNNADLRNAHLQNVNLKGVNLTGVKYNSKTRIPFYILKKRRGMIKVEDGEETVEEGSITLSPSLFPGVKL